MNPNPWISQSPPLSYNSPVWSNREGSHFFDEHYTNSSRSTDECGHGAYARILHSSRSYRYPSGKFEPSSQYDLLTQGSQYYCPASIEPARYDRDTAPMIMASPDQFLQHSPYSAHLLSHADDNDRSHITFWPAEREDTEHLGRGSLSLPLIHDDADGANRCPLVHNLPSTVLAPEVVHGPAFITFEIPQATQGATTRTVKFADGQKPRQALACLFCRKRKIPCGRPAANAVDQTCNALSGAASVCIQRSQGEGITRGGAPQRGRKLG
ncbi:hypothetical protein C8R45DRAFT_929502 [Mycena sanguinolenta]|nr:hypothetical protein C8R45DRAFT_929502 [Mycena sanguinolenta]